MTDMTLEKIISFHMLTLGDIDSEKMKKAIALGIDFEEYKRRIVGKKKELEFLLILKALRVLNHLDAFDESFSHITNEFTSDYLVEFRDNYKCMIEIKHTDKDSFSISSGNLNNRINFAKRHGVPLRFAISIKGIWGLYTSEYLQENNGKVNIVDGLSKNSWFEPELDTCSYGFLGSIRIESVYCKNHQKGMGIFLKPYGELISQKVFFNNKQIFKAKGKKNKYLRHIMLLGALQDRLSSNRTIKKDGEYTVVTDETGNEGGNFISEYEFVLSFIRHLSPIKGSNPDDNISAALYEKKFNYPYIEHFRDVLFELNKMGLTTFCSRQGSIFAMSDFVEKIWKYSIK